MPGAASAFLHFDCLQLVLGARCRGRCRRSASARGVVGAAERAQPLGSPAGPAPGSGQAGQRCGVRVTFPGNLSFRRYTCAYLVRGATTERIFSRFILGVGFRELPSPLPDWGCGVSCQIDTLGQGPSIAYPVMRILFVFEQLFKTNFC